MYNEIQRRAKEMQPVLVDIRRYLHQHPELSTEEVNTGKYIESKLREWGIPCKGGYSKTGVVGIIEGLAPGIRCVALRADMDALPIREETGLEFASQVPGVMHACGHDVHMTCLLGAAKLLKDTCQEWEGTVKLIFQPSEEDFRAGAPVMIQEGVLLDPAPSKIFALHVLPEMDCGKIGYKAGQYMASTDELYLKVIGKAGHGATPELTVDPVLMSAHILTALQQIVSRQAPPYIPTVLSFGRIIGEGRTNIIPAEVNIEGTIRTFNEEWRAKAHERIRLCAEEIAKGLGGRCELEVDHGYPFVYNDEEATAQVKETGISLLGKENVEELPLRMTAEDFAYYTQEIPGCMFRLGVRPKDVMNPSSLHTSTLAIDEECLPVGAAMMALLGIYGK